MAVTAFVSGIRLATMSVAASPGLWRVRMAGAFKSPVIGGLHEVGDIGRKCRSNRFVWQRLREDDLIIVRMVTNQPRTACGGRCAIIGRGAFRGEDQEVPT